MKWFATLGVGGILAGITLWFYRLDREASEKRLAAIIESQAKDREASERAMEKLITDHRTMAGELLEVVKQNTRAVQSLTETFRSQQQRSNRQRNSKQAA